MKGVTSYINMAAFLPSETHATAWTLLVSYSTSQ